MSAPNKPVGAIFDAAIEMPAERRAAYLDTACAGDDALRQRVEALLRANELAGTFMDSPAQPLNRETIRLELPPSEMAGDQIGRYKLLQQIGEGGCGVVYMAEQEQPVKRRVALKVIKLGMDTKSVIARFAAERQALALMDHPNIAKVLDAGATDTGRPYFVMELVRGIKITDFCDQNNLSTQDRLDLFMQVCQAVQHAHQKGIIHRDIKPSNILVTMTDGVPTPKVIDFGIAKATQGKLTDETVFTAFEQFIGTPAYMSPEQAEMSALDIDTRSDIYSLGVLLYELLTGKTPFDAKELLRAGLDEIRRTIREQEPSRPSTRLSTMMAADLTTVAAHRQAQPPKLIHLVSGDLDWIVMKALEKDRTRRYDTANGFAADIQRHLDNEPVLASPPGASYRIRKFARRHRVGVLAGSLVLLVLIAGIIGTTWGLLDALHEKREAQRQAKIAKHTTEFLTGMFKSIDPETAKLRDITVREILDQASQNIGTAFPGDPMTELPIRRTMVEIYDSLGKPDAALIHAQAALALVQLAYGDKDSWDKAESLDELAVCLDEGGRFAEALPMHQQALAMSERIYHGDNTNLATVLCDLAAGLDYLGRSTESLPKYEEALAMYQRIHKGDDPDVAANLNDVAVALAKLGRSIEALPKFEAALAMNQRIHKGDNPNVATDLHNIANCLSIMGRSDEALAREKEALSMDQRIYKGDNPNLATRLYSVAVDLFDLGNLSEALPYYEAAVAMDRRIYKGDHPDLAERIKGLAVDQRRLGRYDEAFTNFATALAMDQRICQGDNPDTEDVLENFATALSLADRPAQALPKFEECLAMCQRLFPHGSSNTAQTLNDYALCLEHLNRWDEALTNYEASLSLYQRFEQGSGANTAIVCNHVGDCFHVLGRSEEACQQYAEAMAIYQRITIARPANNPAKIGLAKSRQKLGDVLSEMGKAEDAITNYQTGLYLTDTVLASDGTNAVAKTLRLTCRVRLGLDKAKVLVSNVLHQALAEEIGLKTGDVLVRYDGKPILCSADLPVLTGRAAGTGIELEIRRDGLPLKFTVNAGPLGVHCEDRVLPLIDSK